MKRLALATLICLTVSPAFATFNVLFTPSPNAASHTCTAFERHRRQANPEVGVINNQVASAGAIYTLTEWAAVTCTVVGRFQGGSTYYAQIANASLDPNLPDLQVIACIKALSSDGATSECIDAVDFTPTDPANPLAGGAMSAAPTSATTVSEQ